MIKVYLKQAWELLKQNKLFSMLYIVGTGLAIAMTMIMAVVYYVKIAPVYPEANRMNTLYLSNSKFTQGSGNNTRTMQWAVSYKALQDWFYPVENALVVSAELHNDLSENSYIQPADRSGDFPVMVKLTDPAFFKIYSFQFLEGSPFTASDLASGISTAVVTDDLARRLFGTTEEVVGRSFSLNYIDYRVCGVVRSASYLTSKSYAQLYVPYTVSPDYSSPKYNLPYLGAFSATFLVKDGKQGDALRAEIKEICRKENLMHPDEWQVDFWEQPTSHLLSVFKTYSGMEFDLWATVRHFLLVLLVLLLVPALNLSGMISSRMEGRLAEMGVRKSFGAGRKILLSQVMWENLLLTALGGALGLLLAWLALYVGREWIFTVFDSWPNYNLVRYVKDFDGVESATPVLGFCYPNSSGSSNSQLFAEGDTIPLSIMMIQFLPHTNFFDTYGFRSGKGRTPGQLSDYAYAPNDIVLTENAAEQLFHTKDAHGKRCISRDHGDTLYMPVVGTIGAMKMYSEWRPVPVAFMPMLTIDTSYIPESAHILVRLKEGVSMERFLHDFRPWMVKEMRRGNLFARSVRSYEQIITESEASNSTPIYRRNLAMAAFFLVNLCLGVIGTFWLQTRTRREEVGVMLSFGATRSDIVRLLMGEGTVLTVVASLTGFLLYLQYALKEGLAKGQNWVESTESYWVSDFTSHYLLVSLVIFLILLVVVLVGIYIPARNISRIPPTEALRDE